MRPDTSKTERRKCVCSFQTRSRRAKRARRSSFPTAAHPVHVHTYMCLPAQHPWHTSRRERSSPDEVSIEAPSGSLDVRSTPRHRPRWVLTRSHLTCQLTSAQQHPLCCVSAASTRWFNACVCLCLFVFVCVCGWLLLWRWCGCCWACVCWARIRCAGRCPARLTGSRCSVRLREHASHVMCLKPLGCLLIVRVAVCPGVHCMGIPYP